MLWLPNTATGKSREAKDTREKIQNHQAACLRQKGKRQDRRSEKKDRGDGRDRKKRPVTMTSVSKNTPALSARAAVSGIRQAAAHFKST